MAKPRPVRGVLLGLLISALVMAACLPQAGQARALAPLSGEEVRGELDNWGSAPAWSMSASLGGTFVHVTGQVTNASDSVSEFKFFKDSNQWYGNGSSSHVCLRFFPG